jgi:RNA polymerase sigma factor (sigma-70 family)
MHYRSITMQHFFFCHIFVVILCVGECNFKDNASSNCSMENKTDEYYIREILKGDSGSFSQLVEKYQHLAYTLSLKILNQREDAEDAAQEAFIKAYNSLKFFNGKSTFRTWFFRIVYNTAIIKLRSVKKAESKIEDIRLTEGEISDTESAMNHFNTEDRLKYLKIGLEKLEPEEQALLTMYYYDDFPMDEVAKITGLTVSNVKVKIHRSRKRLLKELTLILKDEVISIL